jgi:hypothetical protein
LIAQLEEKLPPSYQYFSFSMWLRLHYPTLFILEPQLGHAISLCSFPQLMQ